MGAFFISILTLMMIFGMMNSEGFLEECCGRNKRQENSLKLRTRRVNILNMIYLRCKKGHDQMLIGTNFSGHEKIFSSSISDSCTDILKSVLGEKLLQCATSLCLENIYKNFLELNYDYAALNGKKESVQLSKMEDEMLIFMT